jgi:hypothetical protein
MKTTLRQKLEDIDNECRDTPPELAEAALGIIRLKIRDALQDVAKLQVSADIAHNYQNIRNKTLSRNWPSPVVRETYTL